jgi:hypothetical protein
MVDQEIIRIARDRTQLEIAEQNARIKEEIERIKAEMSARGTLHSSMTLKRITDICADAVKTRGQLAWQTYFRFLTTAGISHSDILANKLKELVSYHLPEQLGDLKGYVKQNADLVGSPNLFDGLAHELDKARAATLAKVGTEIDLFVHSLRKKEEMKIEGKSSTVVNIYSPVGSIQTGDYATANVTQHLDADVRAALSEALNQIAATLADSNIALPQPKAEIVELVDEGQQELKKNTPNITKLRSLLSAVGGSIQTVASMKPAYETLKQALTFVGISLP